MGPRDGRFLQAPDLRTTAAHVVVVRERDATSIVGIFDRSSRQTARCWAGPWAFLQMARWCNCAGDLPDVSKCFCRAGQNIHAGGKMLLCMGLFSIF
jgi:hypothetical protein